MSLRRAPSLLLIAGLSLCKAAGVPTAASEKVSQLLNQPEGLAQLNLLSAPDLKFDFSTQPDYTFAPGAVVNANTDSFPAVTGHGLMLAVINLGPCSMLPPHHHPRADNFVVLTGSNPNGTVDTYMIQENNAPVIEQTLKPMQMTIFPKGALHTMVNTGCNNVQLISALNSENAGTLTAANNFYRLNSGIIGTVLGETNDELNATMNKIAAIGTSSIAGNAECLSTCGLSNVKPGSSSG